MSFSDGRLIKRVYVSTSESEILSEGKMHMCSRDQVSNMRSTSHPGRANNTVIIPRYASDSKMKAQEGVENPNSLFNQSLLRIFSHKRKTSEKRRVFALGDRRRMSGSRMLEEVQDHNLFSTPLASIIDSWIPNLRSKPSHTSSSKTSNRIPEFSSDRQINLGANTESSTSKRLISNRVMETSFFPSTSDMVRSKSNYLCSTVVRTPRGILPPEHIVSITENRAKEVGIACFNTATSEIIVTQVLLN